MIQYQMTVKFQNEIVAPPRCNRSFDSTASLRTEFSQRLALRCLTNELRRDKIG